MDPQYPIKFTEAPTVLIRIQDTVVRIPDLSAVRLSYDNIWL